MEPIANDVQRIAARIMRLRKSHPQTTRQADYDCNECQDIGVVAVLTETGETVPASDVRLLTCAHTMRPCRCVRRRHIDRLFQSSRINERFKSVGFERFVVDNRPACVRQARDMAWDYYRRFQDVRHKRVNSLVLLGPPGSGKTHLLMAVSNQLMRHFVAVHYFPWVEGFGDLKSNLEDLEERLHTMKQVDVLFLDDLFKGRQRPTDFMLEQLFGVINYRYLNCLPILVSSERSVNEIFAIDEGIGRRIYEMAEGHGLQMVLTSEEAAAGMELDYSLVRR